MSVYLLKALESYYYLFFRNIVGEYIEDIITKGFDRKQRVNSIAVTIIFLKGIYTVLFLFKERIKDIIINSLFVTEELPFCIDVKLLYKLRII